MQKLLLLIAITMLFSCSGNSQSQDMEKQKSSKDDGNVIKRTDEEWKAMLTDEQYHILREKGTDRPFTGKYNLHKEKGVYSCAGCGVELFTSEMKFDSNCGWPSFDTEIAGGKVKKVEDRSHGMVRTEILCARCGSHLGHLFDDGPTLTGLRYCVNSTSIDFKKDN